MKSFVAESGVEEVCLEYFADLGWQVLYGPDIAPGETHSERSSYRDVLLEGRLRAAISWLNPKLSPEVVDQAVATVRRAESADALSENWRVHHLLTHGVPLERRNERGELRHDLVRLVDFEYPERNDFVVVNQVSIEQERKTRRPDVLAFVNGLPLALIELKVPGQERATLRGAWNQLRTYASEIPNLLACNAISADGGPSGGVRRGQRYRSCRHLRGGGTRATGHQCHRRRLRQAVIDQPPSQRPDRTT